MDYMQRALSLARKALGNVSPNPAVGAVLVKDGSVIGEGCTQPPGMAHAEVMALRQAGDKARGSALWVTLEPCCHFGRTPPCTRAVISSGITEVHMSMIDPNPLVCGQGKAELDRTGIRTYVGDGEAEARELNEAYIKYITTGLPFVIAKFAMSLDGKIATTSGDSKWISGGKSRNFVHELRKVVDAVMVGVNTVVKDDPQLTARPSGNLADRQPLRVVVDSRGRTPTTAKLLQQPGKSLIAATRAAEEKEKQLIGAGAEVLELPERGSQVDLMELLKALGRREVTSVLVEGGGTLLGSLFDQGLVDKIVVFIAPIVVGGEEARSPVAGMGVNRVSEALKLSQVKVDRVGDDIMVSGYVNNRMIQESESACSLALSKKLAL